MRRVWPLRLLVVVGLVLGVVAACDGAAEPNLGATPTPMSSVVLTNQDWPLAHADPSAVGGARVVLRARVYSVSKVGNDLVLCGWVDFDNDQLSTLFRVPDTEEGVERDAFVWVEGVVTRVADVDDGCEDAPQPEVEVSGLTVTDRLGVRPVVRMVRVGQALERRGIRVVLERVEFADEETRIYFTLENRGDETLLAFGTGLEIEVDGTEIPAVIPIGEGIPAPRGRVEPGATEHGGFQFPALEPSGPPITVRWMSARMAPSGEDLGELTWVVDPTGVVTPEG